MGEQFPQTQAYITIKLNADIATKLKIYKAARGFKTLSVALEHLLRNDQEFHDGNK